MGYTNYWENPTPFRDDQWALVTDEAEYIREWVAGYSELEYGDIPIAYDFLINSKYCDKECIAFDGGYETFMLKKDKEPFGFCKTGERNYDLLVWHMLVFCSSIKLDFRISRDRVVPEGIDYKDVYNKFKNNIKLSQLDTDMDSYKCDYINTEKERKKK